MLELPKNFGLNRLRAALKQVKNRRTAIDIGAHKGIWTKKMMEEFDSVYSFEPVEDNFRVLKEINCNSFQVALGDNSDWSHLMWGDNTGMYHIADEGLPCIIKPLDTYKIPSVDFIKIDVEGYELHVLIGAQETINNYHPDILLEENGLTGRYGYSHDDLWEHMDKLGYKNTGRWQDDYLWTVK